jgi:hypothetical protein
MTRASSNLRKKRLLFRDQLLKDGFAAGAVFHFAELDA